MTSETLTMKLMDGSYGVCRLAGDRASIPDWALDGDFTSITRTQEELSLVCPEGNIPEGETCEMGWRILKVEGPLDFALVGILSAISGVLAVERISIFAISTFNTDYILVKDKDIDKAVSALSNAGYRII